MSVDKRWIIQDCSKVVLFPNYSTKLLTFTKLSLFTVETNAHFNIIVHRDSRNLLKELNLAAYLTN